MFQKINRQLVAGSEHFFHLLGIRIPTDALIFVRAVAQPPTRKDKPSRWRQAESLKAESRRAAMNNGCLWEVRVECDVGLPGKKKKNVDDPNRMSF